MRGQVIGLCLFVSLTLSPTEEDGIIQHWMGNQNSFQSNVVLAEQKDARESMCLFPSRLSS